MLSANNNKTIKFFEGSKTVHELVFPWMTVCGLVLDDRAEDSFDSCNCGRCKNGRDWDNVLYYDNGFGVLIKNVAREHTDRLAEPHPTLGHPFVEKGLPPEQTKQAALDWSINHFEGHCYFLTIYYPWKIRTHQMQVHFGYDKDLCTFVDCIIQAIEFTDKEFLSANKVPILKGQVYRKQNNVISR